MTPVSRSNFLLMRLLPVLLLALLIVAAAILALPWSGYTLMDTTFGDNGAVLRPIVLLTSYTLVAIAAYRRTGDGLASVVAMLFGAALGWAGWEWQTVSLGWSLFSGLVLLLTWPGERPALFAVAVIIPWAALHPGGAWGALLLIAAALSGARTEARRRLILLLAGIAACALLLLRGVDLPAVWLSAARPWIWVEGQAQNSLADPAGLALFTLLLALLGLKLLRPTRTPESGLAILVVFGFLAWHTRRNGIWLGLAATPLVASAITGDWKTGLLPERFARWIILSIATSISCGLLYGASVMGPSLIGGNPLPAAAVDALPDTGLIAYRPEFEPALLRNRPRSDLVLARPADDSLYRTWELIATNCAPGDLLQTLQARAIVLQPVRDASVITTLQNQGWQVTWSGEPAVVLLQPGTAQ